MLSALHLESFKCFEGLDLPLRELTVLSGTNGGGKSSVIQAVVLLNQTLMEREASDRLLLAGRDLALGTAGDVLNQRSARRQFAIGATADEQKVMWSFRADDRRAFSVAVESALIDDTPVELHRPLRWLLPPGFAEASPVVSSLRRLGWITAERTGPRELLPLWDSVSHTRVGPRGELAAGLLYWRTDDPVRTELCVGGHPPTLFHQVRARMQEFFPGCDLRVSPIDGAGAVSLRLRMDSRSEFMRPQNVGFGLTQLFPIVVGLLAASRGDCLIIENPEVHLHPKAQQQIGWLLALVAASGVQVLVETHSDHVLNGIRLATKRGDIPFTQVAMHFFAPNQGGGKLTPQSPTLDADGRLSDWPEGFFDQFDLALSELL